MDKTCTNKRDDAAASLVQTFLPYIKKRASRIKSMGLAFDDLVQEGLIGLLDAIDGFDETVGIPFDTYAITCIDNRVYSALRKDARKKNYPLNNYISISHDEELPAFARVESSPENLMVLREEISRIKQSIRENLSSYERQALSLYLEGYSYLAISEFLSSTPKSVDNALQRARKKIK